MRFSRSLNGNVAAMGTVRLPGSKRDALVLAFRDAKAVVVEYDPARHDIRNVSLHLYEDDKDVVEEGYTRYMRAPLLRVDLAQRCAVMLCLDRKLVVLPFISASSDALPSLLGAGDPNDGSDRSGRLSSYVLNLSEMGIVNVKDIVFLHGYYDPTIAFLYEPKRTWAGRLALQRDTCQLRALTIDLMQRRHPTIWATERLPYDSYALHPLSEAAGGGVLVLSPNVILHVSQNSRLGLSLNSFAVPVENEPAPYPLDESPVVVTLDAATSLSLAHNRVLLSLRGGELYVLHVRTSELGRAVAGLELSKAGNSVPASAICQVAPDLVFLASRLGDSLLLHVSDTRSAPSRAPAAAGTALDGDDEGLYGAANGAAAAPPEKKTRREAGVLTLEGVHVTESRAFNADDEAAEAAALFGTTDLAAPVGQTAVYDFTVEDALPNVGPIADFSVGESRDAASTSVAQGKRQAELVACSGAAKSGSLRILQHGLRPYVLEQYPDLGACRAMWALYGSSGGEQQAAEGGDDLHAYQVLSKEDGTKLLKDLQEVEDNADFFLAGPTLNAGNLYNKARIVQVYAGGVRLLDGTQSVQEVSVQGTVVLSSILDPYVVVVLSSGLLLLLTASSPAKDTLIETEPMLPTVPSP